MGDSPLTRRQLLVGAGALALTAPVLGSATAAFADDGRQKKRARLLRWDLVTFTGGFVLPGGTDVGKDVASGDTVSLTGSGQAEPKDEEANGGGTFVHRAGDGTERAHGIYVVTGFRSFTRPGGSLVGVGVTDGIGELEDTIGGIVALDVSVMPSSEPAHPGVLTVDCNLPGGDSSIHEGITLAFGPHRFVQDTGATLFHLLQGDSD
jgi:hypothetical protein